MKPAVVLIAAVLIGGCGEGQGADPDRRQWRLPANLAEVSGLALDAQGRLLAHDDERGVIHTIDALSGAGVVASVPLDDPIPRADFEGIALFDGRTFLITSKGELFDWTANRLVVTELDPGCEVEGLTDYREQLVAVCKQIPNKNERRVRLLFIDLAIPEIERHEDVKVDFKVRPSAIDWDEQSATFYVLAARPDPRVVIIDRDENVRTRLLDERRHPQPEGIALDDDGWFIADEGAPGMLRWQRGRP